MVETILRLMRSRVWIAAIVAAVAAVHGLWIWKTGVILSSDSHTYSRWADGLVGAGFDYGAYLRDTRFVVPPVLYAVWVTIVALAKVIAGASWPTIIVALNWVSVIGIAALILFEVRRLTGSGLAVTAAGFLILVAFDVLIFVTYALSDILFLLLTTAVIVCAIRVAEPVPGRRAKVVGTILLLVACFFRPTAAPLVALWIMALAWPRLDARKKRIATVATIVGVIAAVIVHAALMQDPSRWPATALSGWIAQLSREYHRGVVVFGRPATHVPTPDSLFGFVEVTGRKLLYYFAAWFGDYSRLHKLANAMFFVPAYLLIAFGLFRRDATAPARRAIAPALFVIAAFSLFHALQQIDFDHRYRLAILPPLIILAAIGAAAVESKVLRREVQTSP